MSRAFRGRHLAQAYVLVVGKHAEASQHNEMREEEHDLWQRVIILECVFGTLNGFWGYHNTELNFSMLDIRTVCCMSKVHRRTMSRRQGQAWLSTEPYCPWTAPAAPWDRVWLKQAWRKCTDTLLRVSVLHCGRPASRISGTWPILCCLLVVNRFCESEQTLGF